MKSFGPAIYFFFFVLGIFILLLILPHPLFSTIIQTTSNLTSLSSYRDITPGQIELMQEDPLFCIKNDDCTTFCGPIYDPNAILVNKQFTQTDAGVQLENTCSASSEDTVFYDHIACIKNTCTAKAAIINPLKIRTSFNLVSRKTRPEVQLPYEDVEE